MTVADATIISRKLAGFSGVALTNGLNLGSGSRNTPAAVNSFLLAGCGATGGTVTSITAGTCLTGGAITASGTIAADTAYLQRRVATACAVGSSIRAIAADDTVTCQTDTTGGTGTVTAVATGPGLLGGPIFTSGVITLDVTQRLPTVACAANQIAKWSGTAWLCATDATATNAWVQGGNAFGAPGGSHDDHPILKHQWYIIVAVCLACMLLKRKRKDQRAERFAELAATLHRDITVVDEFERRFTTNIDGRDFVVTENYDSSRTNDAAGWCLYSSTSLVDDMWKDRSVKICKGQPVQVFGFVLPRVVSGNEVFDENFVITDVAASAKDKSKTLRDQLDENKNRSLVPWRNDATRNAITAFYDLALPLEPLLVDASKLIHHVAWPCEGIDATTLTSLLRHQRGCGKRARRRFRFAAV